MNLNEAYGISTGENMCPRDYALSVDTASWGTCSCWGNGGRRSRNGKTATCVAELPFHSSDMNDDGKNCKDIEDQTSIGGGAYSGQHPWCVQRAIDSNNRVCPRNFYTSATVSTDGENITNVCQDDQNEQPDSYFKDLVPEGI